MENKQEETDIDINSEEKVVENIGDVFEAKTVIKLLKEAIQDTFNINRDKAKASDIRKTIVSATTIKGTNMCILVLAIIIASVGLNMNSTAVVIGAMLISPLMGEIVGIAYGFATSDFVFAKRCMVYLLFEVVICIITSTIYFMISPISTAKSELLARTNPTIWDVIIAFSGGLAGIIASTRKEKLATVIPGVSIATALMPPLCTAGFGLATWQLKYFFGALYLFFINGFFICLGSIIVLNVMKLPQHVSIDKKEQRRIKRNLALATVIMIIPSVFLAYQIVRETIINNNFQSFLNQEVNFETTQVVKSNIDITNQQIDIALIGNIISENDINELKTKLSEYGLQGMKLEVTQTEIPKGMTKDEVSSIIQKELVSTSDSSIVSKNSKEIETLQAQILELQTKLLKLESANSNSITENTVIANDVDTTNTVDNQTSN